VHGRREFDSIFADLARGKRNWQLAAFGAIGVASLLAAGLVITATQSRITPYVVEVDALGRAQAFGPAERLQRNDERVLTAQLAGFVRDVRTIVGDPAAQADLVRRAYAFVDQDAAAFLNTYFAAPANDPRLLGRDVTRLVEITGVLPLPGGVPAANGSRTWKVSWTEVTLPRTAGGLPMRTAWEGYFATRLVPPTSAERLSLNPLGLYVTTVNWTQLADRVDAPPASLREPPSDAPPTVVSPDSAAPPTAPRP
jgi:type IV secretion system protein VirB5